MFFSSSVSHESNVLSYPFLTQSLQVAKKGEKTHAFPRKQNGEFHWWKKHMWTSKILYIKRARRYGGLNIKVIFLLLKIKERM